MALACIFHIPLRVWQLTQTTIIPARVIRTLPIKKEGEETEAEKRRKLLGL
jgi:hypothetical protein